MLVFQLLSLFWRAVFIFVVICDLQMENYAGELVWIGEVGRVAAKLSHVVSSTRYFEGYGN